MDWLILWSHPETSQSEVERYESEQEAREALADFISRYPWNTYYLAQIVEERAATTEWEPPFRITYEPVLPKTD